MDQLLKSGHRYVVDADLKSYFDCEGRSPDRTIPHDRLMAEVAGRVADGRVLKLVESFLTARVMEGLEQWTPAAGAPQGAVLSPLLSNIYLNPLDHLMAAGGWEMVRYADDFVILCRTEQQAQAALEAVRRWTAQAGLTLHPDKTRIADAQGESFEFLGYRFDRGRRWPRDKSMAKLKEAIRGKTRRTDGRSLPVVIHDVNRTTRGWFGYFPSGLSLRVEDKHSHRAVFAQVDGWVRDRIRSLLRKRLKLRGRANATDRQRWGIAFFASQGFYSLKEAHTRASRPATAAH